LRVVREISCAFLNFLDLPANRLKSLLNLRGIHWKFFSKGQGSSVKLLTQQADYAHASEDNSRSSYTARQTEFSSLTTSGSKRIARNAARTTVMQIELALVAGMLTVFGYYARSKTAACFPPRWPDFVRQPSSCL
jgi:hypothetical protein